MTTKKAALPRGLHSTESSKRVARGATPGLVPVEDFLLENLEAPPEDAEERARRLFPGPYASQRHLRSAYLEIASARGSSAAGADWLEKARDAIGALQELDRRPTPIEDALVAAREQFAAAIRTCRRAASLIYEARRLSSGRRKLRAVAAEGE